MWRPSVEYEKTTDQREVGKLETILVQLDTGDFTTRVGALILISVGRGTRSCPPRLEASEVESTHALRRHRSVDALPSTVFYLDTVPITHGG